MRNTWKRCSDSSGGVSSSSSKNRADELNSQREAQRAKGEAVFLLSQPVLWAAPSKCCPQSGWVFPCQSKQSEPFGLRSYPGDSNVWQTGIETAIIRPFHLTQVDAIDSTMPQDEAAYLEDYTVEEQTVTFILFADFWGTGGRLEIKIYENS